MPSKRTMRIVLAWTFVVSFTSAWTNPSSNGGRIRRRLATTISTTRNAIKVVVIGGGWAGFSAADALSTATSLLKDDMKIASSTFTDASSSSLSDHTATTTTTSPSIQVELLDASPRGPGGLAGAGWKTPKLGMPVEAGIHGFWREYRNTFAVMEDRIGLRLDDVLTDYTPSVLISQSGRVALAPVLGQQDEAANNNNVVTVEPRRFNPNNVIEYSRDPTKLLDIVATLLPPPLDLALLAKFSPDSPLSAIDRISALGLLGAWADFKPDDYDSWQRYDNMSAESLFCATAGITRTLYRELVSPLLHVLPMTPGYDCSAAAALSCFHVFALQSRGAFDVRWCRGSIQERIFQPWVQVLQARGNANIRGSAKVTAISENKDATNNDDKSNCRFTVTVNDSETISCDAIVFAIGATTMKRLLPNFEPLARFPITKTWDRLRGVTCVAVRLFFRAPTSGGTVLLPTDIERAMSDSPVFVCGAQIGAIPQLAETGFCIYDLQRLQDDFPYQMRVDDKEELVAALEVDFFRADAIANMADNMNVASLTLKAIAAALNIDPIDPTLVLDVSVVRARQAVSHFDVSSASCSPPVKLDQGLYMCGDWIDRTGHASWSTEKAVVTGRQAVAALAQDFSLQCQANVIPATNDSPQLSALRQLMGVVRMTAPARKSGPSPFPLFNQLPF